MGITSTEIEQRLDLIEARLAKLEAAPVKTSGGEVADDSELDSQYGNPVVRKDPPRWKGESYAGQTYSACPAAYLESLAGFLDWAADKDEQKLDDAQAQKYARYKRTDAKRARGWIARIKAGYKPPVSAAPVYDEEAPF